MAREIVWNFYKVVLQQDASFAERQKILTSRFENADTYVSKWRDTEYRYQIYDFQTIERASGSTAVVGRLTRSPKVAHGRSLDTSTGSSTEGSVNIDSIADTTEFIYDLDSCVLALHRRAPFTSVNSVARVLSNLLGMPYKKEAPKELDVHAEAIRDESYSETLFDSEEPLKEVKLTYAKPNPGSGDDILAKVHLGLIGEETNSDIISFDAKKKDGGSLTKESGGFFRRSIKALLGLGYLKNGFVRLGDKRYDLKDAKEKERETSGYGVDQEGKALDLAANAAFWLDQMTKENSDIYPEA